MAERFYAGETNLENGAEIALSTDESHHLLKVMRARPGEVVRVFGGGREFDAALIGRDRDKARLKLLTPVQSVPLPRLRLLCGIPWIKGSRTEAVARQLTELGAAELLVFHARR